MRLRSIRATDVAPVLAFDVSDLSDVVVLAGRNGVGKTRLIQALVQFFRSPTSRSNIRLVVESTAQSERDAWGKSQLDTAVEADAQQLTRMLQQSRRRTKLRSSVVQFESDRSIVQIMPYSFTWDFGDPYEEQVGWDGTFSGLRSRFQDTLHSIFRKVRSQREQIAQQAETLMRDGTKTMTLDWPDPLAPFKDSFSRLLAPKQLVEANLQQQTLIYREGTGVFQINQLSSGEREVVNIVFDFLLRGPEDCIVFFDEPELHLHPELSYKLLQTLRHVGARNQFIFCTHSPDIITASLDQSVVFVGPPSATKANQAIPVREDDETNQALRLLGQSVGIIALGKRLVLIEGTAASLDKQTYGSILRDRYPDLVLVPSGGRGVISSFNTIIPKVLEKTLWGVDFFMVCDRDALPAMSNPAELETASSGRLRVLSRYHLENYFLDSTVLANVFTTLEPADSWLTQPEKIEAKLVELAAEHVSYAAALIISAQYRQLVGNADLMPKNCHGRTGDELAQLFHDRVAEERGRIDSALDPILIGDAARAAFTSLQTKLAAGDNSWKTVIPGRPILHAFASHTGLNAARIKQAYILASESITPSPFVEVIDMFSTFSKAAASNATQPADGSPAAES